MNPTAPLPENYRRVLEHFTGDPTLPIELTYEEALELIPGCTGTILRALRSLGALATRSVGCGQRVYHLPEHA